MKNTVVMTDAQTIFQKRCVQCHGPHGEGGIGPNLTDDSWLHGKGTLMDIFGVVNGGVAGKGMPEWGKQLPKVEIAKAAAYVGTLRGRHVPGKAPEGTVLASVSSNGK
jgi:cytochrome c oxidase cbb3-type subunit 3